jgi:hypothetical protein
MFVSPRWKLLNNCLKLCGATVQVEHNVGMARAKGFETVGLESMNELEGGL